LYASWIAFEMGYVEEDQGPEHAEARGILEDMTQYLQEGKFEACLSLEGKVAELADSIASSAPGLAGKMFGNLSSAYAQLRQYDKAVAMTRRHLEIWESAKHLPEQQAVLREQITAYKEFDGRDLTYLMQRGCASRDWDAVIALRDRIEAYMVDPSCDRTWTCEIANNLGLVYLSGK
jgi:tetratricopeptide (TPR) repeat protein